MDTSTSLGTPTWVEQTGAGDETVLLLHGGLSSCDDLLGTVGPTLAEHYRVVAFDRRGHGRTADTDAPFHYADMAVEVLGVLEMVVGGPAHLVGFSDGGNVALLVALDHPELVGEARDHRCELPPLGPHGVAACCGLARRSR